MGRPPRYLIVDDPVIVDPDIATLRHLERVQELTASERTASLALVIDSINHFDPRAAAEASYRKLLEIPIVRQGFDEARDRARRAREMIAIIAAMGAARR